MSLRVLHNLAARHRRPGLTGDEQDGADGRHLLVPRRVSLVF
jgi:hypothetical protein